MPTNYDEIPFDDYRALRILGGGLTRFGWQRGREGAPHMACKGPFVAARGGSDFSAPLFSFCTLTNAVRRALDGQTVGDCAFADEGGAWQRDGLAAFTNRLGTYLVIVDDEDSFSAACDGRRNFLLRLFVQAVRTGCAAFRAPGGCVVPLTKLIHQPWVAKTSRGLVEDLVSPAIAGDGWHTLPSGPFARMVAVALPDLPVHVWACGSSALYGHEAILQRHVGGVAIGGDAVPIRGKLQHGWQVGTGLDGELGFRHEVSRLGLPAYVWATRNTAAAKEAGFSATAIGAPILYTDPVSSPPPQPRLLAFPTHSAPGYKIALDWRAYGEGMTRVAREHGLDGATVCLHPLDYDADARQPLEEVGCLAVQLDSPFDPPQEFLLRLQSMVLAHAAVTADRVCTAGFYSLLLGRPFFVSGPAIHTTPPDPDEGPSGDPDWIEANFPTLRPDVIDREVALRELGAEHKRSPAELKQILWGWLDD